ncbi:BTAD domain-containing putative transcriptional regulator, partial [Streptomyces sp. SL13]
MDAEPDPDLRFALLGPVRVWRAGKPVTPGSPQQRALLAALLLRGGRSATADELIGALWGEQPPDSALAALRTYAFRLRKTLGADTLTSVSGGYALRTTPDGLDVCVAERHTAAADRARAAGDPAGARELLSSALELWSGEPLAGLPGPYADNQRARLAELRLRLLESRLELDLELGEHAEAVSELTALTAEHPLRERLRALLMLALYRGGRQAEALGVYADTRRLLADELGVDPCAELAELHQRILCADPELAPPALPDDPRGHAAIVRPAQLPASVPDFTGRSAFVTELVGELLTAESGVMALSAVAGIGGVGKTTLAVHVAHAVKDAFPDGQLYVDLQGQNSQAAEPETVLASFLRALGVPAGAIPDGLADRAALYRSVLDGRRVLTLLDNARDAAQVRPLLPGTQGSAALITSRVRMVGLAGARLLDVDVLTPLEALELFTRIVGDERVLAERQMALEVVAACGYLPLAIRIAASRLANRRGWTVSVLARKLADERHRLDELKAGDLAVKATFELGYGQLSPEQARAFRLLALPHSRDLSLHAAAAVLDLDPYQAEELIESLVDISLLESSAPARYRFHDLLRLYARDCAERDETAADRQAALIRLMDFYLATATAVYALENPGDRVLDHLLAAGRPGLEFASRHESLDWLHAEAPGLLAEVARQAGSASGTAGLRHAVDLLWASQDLLEAGGHVGPYERCTRAVVAAAVRTTNPLVEGRGRVLLSRMLSWATDRHADADTEARRSQLLGESASDPLTSSYAPNLRGMIAKDQGRYADAAGCYRAGLAAFRADGNQHGVAAALGNLAITYVELGQLTSALANAQESVTVLRKLNSGFRLGSGLYQLGFTMAAGGDQDGALARFTEALAIFRESRQTVWEGATLRRMAQTQLASGRLRQAASLAEQSLAVVGDGDVQWQKPEVLVTLGTALHRIGQADRARACWHNALSLLSDPDSEPARQVRELLAGAAPEGRSPEGRSPGSDSRLSALCQ